MPRKIFKNAQEQFEYELLKIARADNKDSPSNAKTRLAALIEWAEHKGIKTHRIKKEDFQEHVGVEPPSDPPKEEKPKINFMDDIEKRG